jgi:hypothetical protein
MQSSPTDAVEVNRYVANHLNQVTHAKGVLEMVSAKNIREGFIGTCQDFGLIAAGYNHMISERQWREFISNLQTNFVTIGERAREAPEEANFPHIKQTRITTYSNLERGIRLYFQRPEIFFELIFAYLVQEWQVFLDEITQGEFENEKYYKKFEHVKEKLGVKDFPPDLVRRTRLYVEVRNNLQHSRRKLRRCDLDGLGVKEFELLYKRDGTKKKYKEGDTVAITAATVFEANNDFIEAAKKLVP